MHPICSHTDMEIQMDSHGNALDVTGSKRISRLQNLCVSNFRPHRVSDSLACGSVLMQAQEYSEIKEPLCALVFNIAVPLIFSHGDFACLDGCTRLRIPKNSEIWHFFAGRFCIALGVPT